MTQQEAVNVLIAVACCSTAELTCTDCPRCKDLGDRVIADLPTDATCEGWNEHEVAEAVKVLRSEECRTQNAEYRVEAKDDA